MANRFHISDFRNWKLTTIFVHPAFIFACASIGAIVGSMLLWNKYSSDLFSDRYFHADESNLVCSEQPNWIVGDLKYDILESNQLLQVDLLDVELVPKLTDAFANNSWVSKVNRIRKMSSGVEIDLQFRRPVALVEVRNNQLLPIDQQAHVLDSLSLSKEYARRCWRIYVAQPAAVSILNGQSWEDRRITDAAILADALFELREQLDLTHILQMTSSHQYEIARGSLVLSKPGGAQIIWGASPNYQVEGEATFDEKLSAIQDWIKQNGTFDTFSKSNPNKNLVLDVRSGEITIEWKTQSRQMINVQRN